MCNVPGLLREWGKPVSIASEGNTPRRRPPNSSSERPICMLGLTVVVLSMGGSDGSLVGMADSVLRIISI